MTHGIKTNGLVCSGVSEIVSKLKFPKEKKEKRGKKREGRRE